MGKEGFGIVVCLHIYRDKTMWLRLYHRITNYQSRYVTEEEFDRIVSFLIPHKEGTQNSMEKYLGIGKDKYGLYFSCKVR